MDYRTDEPLTLREAFPTWKTGGGIFIAITALEGYVPPWSASGVSAVSLDLQYFGNHSGKKRISPLIDSMLDYELDPVELFPADIDILALTIKELYSKNWTNLWNSFNLTYEPLVNYDITETLTKTDTNTGTVTDAGTLTHGATINTVTSVDATGAGNAFGFNSAVAVPVDTTTASNDGTNTETHSGVDSNGNTQTNNLTNETTSTFTRKGDASVRSAQEIINAELKLWQTKFFDIIFADVDTVLSIQVY